MSLTETRSWLIRDLLVGRMRLPAAYGLPGITAAEFCARWPVEPAGIAALAGPILDDALVEQDPTGVFWGFGLATYCGTAAQHLPTLLAIAPQGWHHSHEDVVFFMADLRRPECLPVFTTLVNARFEYLAYDDNRALAVKCIWGMGKLGTEEAVRELEAVLRSPDPILWKNARRQLERISTGGGHPSVSEAARAVLLHEPPWDDDE